jgi:hypothetical protein
MTQAANISPAAFRRRFSWRGFAHRRRISLLVHAMMAAWLTHALPSSSASTDARGPLPATVKSAAVAPTFDMTAARASARALAREDRKATAALALSQETTRAMTTGQIQERLERARRGNCLKANESMNLLANVVMLARDIVATAVDDSGCKW